MAESNKNSDKLKSFVADSQSDDDSEQHESDHVEKLLLFNYGNAMFGVKAQDVDTVIAWRAPSPLPQSGTNLWGVLQDKGRVVAVLAEPIESENPKLPETCKRILICSTPSGLVGLPATTTRGVEVIKMDEEAIHATVIDSEQGALTYLEPEKLVAGLKLQ